MQQQDEDIIGLGHSPAVTQAHDNQDKGFKDPEAAKVKLAETTEFFSSSQDAKTSEAAKENPSTDKDRAS